MSASGTSWNMVVLRCGSGLLLRRDDGGVPWPRSESACELDRGIIVGGQVGQNLNSTFQVSIGTCLPQARV